MSEGVKIQPANPLAAYLAHQAEIDSAILSVLKKGHYILGKEVTKFEDEWAQYLGIPFALGTASGTEALQLALRACGIQPSDEVLTVSHTAVATVAAIELCGASPVWVEINPESGQIDPASLEQVIQERLAGEKSGKLKAVIAVHLYGYPVPMDRILPIARRYQLKIIEDCAQSHGTHYLNRVTGSWGDAAAFSFYPTKNLGALGDGGAVVTKNPQIATQVRLLREYGWENRYISQIPGMNSRLDEIQAAVLRVKLKYLDQETRQRRHLAALYDQALKDVPVSTPHVSPQIWHTYHQYVIRCPHRDQLRKHLSDHGIGTLIHYPVPVHLQPAYLDRLPLPSTGLTQTEQYCREILSLPMHPHLPEQDILIVVQQIREFYKKRKDVSTFAYKSG